MFEISSHKVSSILSIYKQNLDNFLAKSSKSVLDDTVTQRADNWGFGSTDGYNITPHYRLLGSLHVIEIFKKLAAENTVLASRSHILAPETDLKKSIKSRWKFFCTSDFFWFS